MSGPTYRALALDWRPRRKWNHGFNLFVVVVVVGFMALGIVLDSIELPEETKEEKVKIPERVARFVLDRHKRKPRPPPKPKKEVKPQPPPPKAKPKVARTKPNKTVELTEKQASAREKAKKSGLLALSSELADLMDTSEVDAMVGNKVRTGGGGTTTSAVDTDKLTQSAGAGSGGVDEGAQLARVGNTQLSNAQRSVARELVNAKAVKKKPKSSGSENGSGDAEHERVGEYRSEEDIAYVMDKNKSKLYSIYRRARRYSPGLQGKIVLQITILPSGKVASVVIESSELNDPKLESRLVARIKQFDFGLENVKKVTVTLPVEFLPS